MKKYYACGNFGYGTICIAFASRQKRDEFVGFGNADMRRALTRADAEQQYKLAIVDGATTTTGCEKWINIRTGEEA